MKKNALLLLQSLPDNVLNHKRRRVIKLLRHFAFRGIPVDASVRDNEVSFSAGELSLGGSIRLLPWTSRHQHMSVTRIFPKEYSMVLTDTDLDPETIPPGDTGKSGLVFFSASPTEQHAGPEPECLLPYAYPAARDTGKAFIPVESISAGQGFRPDAWFKDRPGMLMCLEPNSATLAVTARFIDTIWPVIFELCPHLVLRLPDAFSSLGLAPAAGVEWISMQSEEQINAQVNSACMAVIPPESGIEAIDKHALFARHGLPCLCAENLAEDLIPPLRFSAPVDAALLSYRLMTDENYRTKIAQHMIDFAQAKYSRDAVYHPLDRLVGYAGQ
ncbi:hypothetical protein [Kordiimonas aestuarii]|uniref:hypothetical protein n=1 Tax=Kordiimonas aestuarii TaxID=1005925 RepID=UPI0021CF8AD4|nr:hypothetical protein [Kordiimonas aestuarii]